jgi:hypothetical protein
MIFLEWRKHGDHAVLVCTGSGTLETSNDKYVVATACKDSCDKVFEPGELCSNIMEKENERMSIGCI